MAVAKGRDRRRRAPRWISVAALVLVVGVAGRAFVLRPRLPAAERGRRLAARVGCFACHGPEGSEGVPNPGRGDLTVPNLRGDLMMFAGSAEEVREWISDGVTAQRTQSESWRRERDRGALVMPAFRDRLRGQEIDDVVQFVLAWQGPGREAAAARRGWERARELGCFGCHGPGGRFARPNPGSLKGYVASWETKDFDELVRDRGEFDAWIQDGVSARLAGNPLASFFLRRSSLRMPAYREHLAPGDLDTLWTYVQWLRRPSAHE